MSEYFTPPIEEKMPPSETQTTDLQPGDTVYIVGASSWCGDIGIYQGQNPKKASKLIVEFSDGTIAEFIRNELSKEPNPFKPGDLVQVKEDSPIITHRGKIMYYFGPYTGGDAGAQGLHQLNIDYDNPDPKNSIYLALSDIEHYQPPQEIEPLFPQGTIVLIEYPGKGTRLAYYERLDISGMEHTVCIPLAHENVYATKKEHFIRRAPSNITRIDHNNNDIQPYRPSPPDEAQQQPLDEQPQPRKKTPKLKEKPDNTPLTDEELKDRSTNQLLRICRQNKIKIPNEKKAKKPELIALYQEWRDSKGEQ